MAVLKRSERMSEWIVMCENINNDNMATIRVFTIWGRYDRK